jgi:agmatine deiminase
MNKNVTEDVIYRLPAAWEPQDAMLLVWPNEQAIAVSEEILELYEALVTVLVDYADVIVVASTNQFDAIKERLALMEVPIEYVYFYDAAAMDKKLSSFNVRDYGPFVVEAENQFVLLAKSKSFSEMLYLQGAMPCVLLQNQDIQFTNDAIESDGGDNLLVNIQILCDRNSGFSVEKLKEYLEQKIAVKNILWLDNPSALTNMIRLCPNNKLVMLDCDEEQSPYYEPMQKLKTNLIQQMQVSGNSLELIFLPWAGVVSCDGIEYLADYSQFVVINEAVLVPLFDLPSDEDAMEVISQLFPGFDILGFPSISLAVLKTGLVRVTHSIPEGVLEPL